MLKRIAATLFLFSAVIIAADNTVFDGTWKLNLSKSKLRNDDLVSQTSTIMQTGPNESRLIDDAVRKSRGTTHTEIIRIWDGKEHPGTGVGSSNGVSEICEIINPSTRKVTLLRDGKMVGVETHTVSADGKVMTSVSKDQVVVRDKQ